MTGKRNAAIAAAAMLLAGCQNGAGIFARNEYTILLHTTTGLGHVRHMQIDLDRVKKLAGWSGLFVIHKANHSELYWGKYPTWTAAENNLKTARTWVVPGQSTRPFALATTVPIPGEPIGPPEYELSNAKGYWTLLVGIFVDSPKAGLVGRRRQRAAVTYCKYLRENGYEAYYRHTSARSQVTVGAFPEEGVVMEMRRGTFVPVVRDPVLRKLMATRDPPLNLLAFNGRKRVVTRRDSKGKLVKLTSRSYPIRVSRSSRIESVTGREPPASRRAETRPSKR